MSSKVLVTGGAGYIGSHVVMALKEKGYQPIVLDNLSRGNQLLVDKISDVPFVLGDIADKSLIKDLLLGKKDSLDNSPICGVIHLAAFAYVGESVQDPCIYYKNNTFKTISLLESLLKSSADNSQPPIPFIFSSSCATFGTSSKTRIDELTPQSPLSPYGWSKLMIEQVLRDFFSAYGLPSTTLRYFNAAGAHPSGLIGEIHEPETHLIPKLLISILEGSKNADIYGNDYPTKDGTCVRDYVHVSDLANAHVLALETILNTHSCESYNLGSGGGFSVLDIVKTIEAVTQTTLDINFLPRRPGDAPVLVADTRKAKNILGWRPTYTLEETIKSAWTWHKSQS